MAARSMAWAKGQSMDKPLELVCPPENMDEFVDIRSDAMQTHGLDQIQLGIPVIVTDDSGIVTGHSGRA